MIVLRTEKEIELLRRANQIVAETLVALADMVAPGVTTAELDAAAVDLIRQMGGKASFLGYLQYPASTCISVDEVIVHGIPGPRVLKEGEIVSMDVGVVYKGYHGDAALTVPCGKVDPVRQTPDGRHRPGLGLWHCRGQRRELFAGRVARRPGSRRGRRILGGALFLWVTASEHGCTRNLRYRTS